MSIHGPNGEEVLPTENFSLRKIVTDEVVYIVITRLPNPEKLQDLTSLPPFIQKKIRNCLENIYSHVTQRKPDEGSKHFFHHIAATVHYERFTGKFVKGRDHSKKAASTVQMIDGTLRDIDEKLKSTVTLETHRPILRKYKNMLLIHKKALNQALSQVSPTKKKHLRQHQNLDVDGAELANLSPEEENQVKQSYPGTPSPQKGKGTPKKLTDNDKDSIAILTPPTERKTPLARRKLDFDSIDPKSDLSDSESSEGEKSFFLSRSEDFLDEDFFWNEKEEEQQSEELDSFLHQQMEALLFSSPLSVVKQQKKGNVSFTSFPMPKPSTSSTKK